MSIITAQMPVYEDYTHCQIKEELLWVLNNKFFWMPHGFPLCCKSLSESRTYGHVPQYTSTVLIDTASGFTTKYIACFFWQHILHTYIVVFLLLALSNHLVVIRKLPSVHCHPSCVNRARARNGRTV